MASFGRRGIPIQSLAVLPRAECEPRAAMPAVVTPIDLLQNPESPTVDEELRAWKAERRRTRPFQIPWGPLSLMASLCFGIASFVLSSSLNDTFGLLLDGLAALAFIAWLAKRRQRQSN